jgi:hypothetical protein
MFNKGDMLSFLGRNGSGNCIGIEITHGVEDLHTMIEPVTSKGETGRCRIEVTANKRLELALELCPYLWEMIPKTELILLLKTSNDLDAKIEQRFKGV